MWATIAAQPENKKQHETKTKTQKYMKDIMTQLQHVEQIRRRTAYWGVLLSTTFLTLFFSI
ncbi:MAG: hypothetical protein VXX91_01880, partial [Planctomycetota bacterium]|nr:hypothetical protein [Planctomycetota bacterium]